MLLVMTVVIAKASIHNVIKDNTFSTRHSFPNTSVSFLTREDSDAVAVKLVVFPAMTVVIVKAGVHNVLKEYIFSTRYYFPNDFSNARRLR